ncbi:MAG TPA: biotin-dependent carboxyltransferase family protein [Archangium sp.]|jgi:biotin-dependent carboxylase-like uncharacterized protein|uniref:5-oxoprolinase subunit C family protein n=1 Tax=Archangium sp. TaxID=1872627 RepID=UPI002EDB5AF0
MDAWLEVLEVGGPVLVQDGGRAGLMHHGVPPGGALVPEGLASGNRAVGNAWGAAALECYGRLELRLHGRSAWVAVDGRAERVEDGGRVSVPAPREAVVRYVAVEGGLAVPEVLGGRGTLLVARLGGLEGRPLKRGDALPLGGGGGARVEEATVLPLESEVRVVLGPDLSRFGPNVEQVLLGSTFTVSPASDRVGMRLRGPSLPQVDEGSGVSGPMVRGAIEVPASGEPIVLGPDHPTTGGYPVVAVVIRADWGRLAARRPGTPVKFQAVSVDEAREIWRRQSPAYSAALNP